MSIPMDSSGGLPPEEKAANTSLGELFGEVTRDLSVLMRQELQLAKAELRESGTQAAKGAGMLGGAGIAAHFAVLFLSLAIWWALGDALDSLGWSAVIVAVVYAIIAGILAAIGRRELRQVEGMPQTAETVKNIPDALKP